MSIQKPTEEELLAFVRKVSRNVCEKTIGEMDFEHDDITWNGIQVEFKNKEEREDVRRSLACYIEFFLQNDLEESGQFDIMFCAKKVADYDDSEKANKLRDSRKVTYTERFLKGLYGGSSKEEKPLKVNIVDVVRNKIPLTEKGKNYIGLCPFHKEKTPSFTVNPTTQLYRCFSCGAHGTAKDFIESFEAGEFYEEKKRKADIDDVKESLKKVIDFLNKNAKG